VIHFRAKSVWWSHQIRYTAVAGLTAASLLACHPSPGFAEWFSRPAARIAPQSRPAQAKNRFDEAIRTLLVESQSAEERGELERACFLAERAAKISQTASKAVSSAEDVSPAATAKYVRELHQRKAKLAAKEALAAKTLRDARDGGPVAVSVEKSSKVRQAVNSAPQKKTLISALTEENEEIVPTSNKELAAESSRVKQRTARGFESARDSLADREAKLPQASPITSPKDLQQALAAKLDIEESSSDSWDREPFSDRTESISVDAENTVGLEEEADADSKPQPEVAHTTASGNQAEVVSAEMVSTDVFSPSTNDFTGDFTADDTGNDPETRLVDHTSQEEADPQPTADPQAERSTAANVEETTDWQEETDPQPFASTDDEPDLEPEQAVSFKIRKQFIPRILLADDESATQSETDVEKTNPAVEKVDDFEGNSSADTIPAAGNHRKSVVSHATMIAWRSAKPGSEAAHGVSSRSKGTSGDEGKRVAELGRESPGVSIIPAASESSVDDDFSSPSATMKSSSIRPLKGDFWSHAKAPENDTAAKQTNLAAGGLKTAPVPPRSGNVTPQGSQGTESWGGFDAGSGKNSVTPDCIKDPCSVAGSWHQDASAGDSSLSGGMDNHSDESGTLCVIPGPNNSLSRVTQMSRLVISTLVGLLTLSTVFVYRRRLRTTVQLKQD
jgi:hypothetical protein